VVAAAVLSSSQWHYQVLWQLAQHDGWSIAGKFGNDDLQRQSARTNATSSSAGVLYFITASSENQANNIFFVRGSNNQPAVMAMAMARATDDKKTGKCIL